MQAAKMARIHCESDQFGGRPLYQAIVDKCRELGIAGATVYRGIEGYGEHAGIHRAGMSHQAPVVITVVDIAANVERLIPAVEPMIGNGMIAISDVEMLRIQK